MIRKRKLAGFVLLFMSLNGTLHAAVSPRPGADLTGAGIAERRSFIRLEIIAPRAGVAPRKPPFVGFAPPSPPPPVSVTAAAGSHQVTLNWSTHLAPAPKQYYIYRGTAKGTEKMVSVTAAPPFTDSALKNGVTYFYFIGVADVGGNPTQESEEVSVTPQLPNLHFTIKPSVLSTEGAIDVGVTSTYAHGTSTGAGAYDLNLGYTNERTEASGAHTNQYQLLGDYQVNSSSRPIQLTLTPSYGFNDSGGNGWSQGATATWAPPHTRWELDPTLTYSRVKSASGNLSGLTPDFVVKYSLRDDPILQLIADYTFNNPVDQTYSWDLSGLIMVNDRAIVAVGLARNNTVRTALSYSF